MLKVKTSLFPVAKALKHNKRQEKTEGIEAPRENPQTNKTAQEDGTPRRCPPAQGSRPPRPKPGAPTGEAGRPAAGSSSTSAAATHSFIFFIKKRGKKENHHPFILLLLLHDLAIPIYI